MNSPNVSCLISLYKCEKYLKNSYKTVKFKKISINMNLFSIMFVQQVMS